MLGSLSWESMFSCWSQTCPKLFRRNHVKDFRTGAIGGLTLTILDLGWFRVLTPLHVWCPCLKKACTPAITWRSVESLCKYSNYNYTFRETGATVLSDELGIPGFEHGLPGSNQESGGGHFGTHFARWQSLWKVEESGGAQPCCSGHPISMHWVHYYQWPCF